LPVKLLALIATAELPLRGSNSVEWAGRGPLTGRLQHSLLTCTQAQPRSLTSLQTLAQERKQMFSSKYELEAIKQSRYEISHGLESHKSTLHVFLKMVHSY